MASFVKENIVDIELQNGNIHRSFLNHSIGRTDDDADYFGVRVFRNGEPVNLEGHSVQGYFRDPQGNNIAITSGNSISGNVAKVLLPQACYNYDGQFTLAIKLVGGGATGTMRIVDGVVDNTNTGGAVAPVDSVPTYQEVLAVYDQMVAAKSGSVRFDITQELTSTQQSKARTNIDVPSVADLEYEETVRETGDNAVLAQTAPKFNEASVYSAGQLVIHPTMKALYKLPDGHAANVTWANTTKVEVTVASELDLKVSTSDIENDLTGTIAGKVLDARQGKVLDDKVSDLKSALSYSDESITNDFEQITGNRALVFTGGRYIAESTPATGVAVAYDNAISNEYACAISPCTAGDKFSVRVYGYTGTNRAYFFLDENMQIVSGGTGTAYAGTNADINTTLTAPTNSAFVVFTNRMSKLATGYYAYKGTSLNSLALKYIRTLSASDTIDSIFDNGIYRAATFATVPSDAPTTSPFVMIVSGAPATDGQKIAYLCDLSGNVYVRHRTSNNTTWRAWVALAKGENLEMTTAFLNSSVVDLLNRDIPIMNNLTKGARATNGSILPTSDGITTSTVFKLEKGTKIEVTVNGDWVYSIVEGNTATSLETTHRLVTDESFVTSGEYIGINLYKTEDGEVVNTLVSDFTGQITMHVAGNANSIDMNEYYRDIPENEGIANVIRRAYQVTKLIYIPLLTMPGFYDGKEKKAGTKHTGVPYCSPRPESLFVPNCVSIDAFMTALTNPNSYLYTRQQVLPKYPGRTFYGAVCSSFVAWCFGIDDTLPTTISFATYPGFAPLPTSQQNYRNIRLGDMLNKPEDHIVIITDIFRNRFGEIVDVEISEEVSTFGARGRSHIEKPSYITSLISNGYSIYRYENIESVEYEPSPWIHVDDSETETPVYNTDMMPRRGDGANWHKGEDIEIDVFSDAYTGWTLEKYDSSAVQITGTISGNLITLTGLAVGRYRLKLTGTADSEYVYFDVKETQGTTYEVQSGRKIKVTPYINSGEPTSVLICNSNPDLNQGFMAVHAFHVFTAEEIEQGYAIVDAPPVSSSHSVNDKWYMACTYKTPFGLYGGQMTLVTATASGTTFTESAYQRSEYIVDYPES